MSLLIKNGYLLNPATNMEGFYDIYIENNLISRIDFNIDIEADTIIDAQDRYIMPGFIDLHVHLREPGFEYKETILTGTLAAAKGGFTTICPMPNTKPSLDSVEVARRVQDIIKKDACVHVLPVGAVTYGQSGDMIAEIEGMVKEGIVAISEDGKSVMNTKVYLQGMKEASRLNIPVFAHCEDKDLVEDGVMNEGEPAKRLGFKGISNVVEDVIIARDILLAKESKAKLHICHCSTKDSVTLVKLAKEEGLSVTGEVCPHHFILCDEHITEDDANYKMNPPLRDKEDVEALKLALKNNIMDVIATDHAPHSVEEKKQSIKDAPFGIVGLETCYSLTVTELVDKGYLTPMQLVEKMSYNPAKILGIDKGSLEVGKVADIVITDPKAEYEINRSEFLSKGINTPFHGMLVKGLVEYTIVDGNIVYKNK